MDGLALMRVNQGLQRLDPHGKDVAHRYATLPRDKAIITFCRISLRGYEAALILSAAGFQDVRVMDGGVQMWPYEKVYGRK